MRRGILKSHSAYNKFAKTEEHARWAIKRRQQLALKGWWKGGISEYLLQEEQENKKRVAASRRCQRD